MAREGLGMNELDRQLTLLTHCAAYNRKVAKTAKMYKRQVAAEARAKAYQRGVIALNAVKRDILSREVKGL